jgi:hypothetical protein
MYYYLRSTLPTLLQSSGVPFSFEGFLARCEGRVNSADYELLKAARAQAPEDGVTAKSTRRSPILTSYRTWEKALKNELVRLRAHKLGKAPERFIRPGDPEWDAVRVAQAAAQCDDPLEGELLIERERWSFVERLETNHLFDLEALVAYALKLQILERRALFEAERGETSYKTAYREILDTAQAPASAGREA